MKQSLKTEPRIKREIGYIFLQNTRVEMASRKIGLQTYQNKAKNLCTIYFVFDLDGACKFIKTKKQIVIKEICSFLATTLVG